jgi:hypothetical protein
MTTAAITPVSAVTSALLERGWEQVDQGPRGMLSAKGKARSPVPYVLQEGSLRWRNLLAGIALVEGEDVTVLAQRLSQLMRHEMPDVPQTMGRTELDLHLDGPGVRNDHETGAWDYGRFVATLADTVKELVKEAAGLAKYTRELQIVGGAESGSVRVHIREPFAAPESQDPLPDHPEGRSPEQGAMLALSQIFNASEDAAAHPADSSLDGHLNLGPHARSTIARLAGIMVRAGWITRGYFVTPGEDALPVALSLAGSSRLQRSASGVQLRISTEVHHGVIDGWTWSTATVVFNTDEGKVIKAAVPMAHQLEVGRLIAGPDQRASITFQMLEHQAPNGGAVSRTFAVSDIAADDPLPIED